MMANQDYTPPKDCIVVQTDFAFDLILRIITQLKDDQELELQFFQEVEIYNIKSNDEDDMCQLKFGGKRAHIDGTRTQCFARTATSVLRMCMLRSANVPEEHYPKLGNYSKRRNVEGMRYFHWSHPRYTFGQEFVLTTNREHAREYYSHYDHLYPHFRIEDQLLKAQPNRLVFIPETMMLIFRENFSEIIVFNTTFQVGYVPYYQQNMHGFYYDIGGYYESYAHVVCQVLRICNPNHACLNVLRLMKGGNWHINTLLRHLTNVIWAEEEYTQAEQGTDDDEREVDAYFAGLEQQPQMPPQNLDHQLNPNQYGQLQALWP